MFKVAAVSMLVLTILGAAGVAVYDSQTSQPVAAQADSAVAQPAAVNTAAGIVPVADTAQTADSQVSAPIVSDSAPAQAPVSARTTAQTGPQVGEAWVGTGVVSTIDATGFGLMLDGAGQIVYVELGPTSYWQGQGVALNAGERVTVQGFTQDGLYHAAVVTLAGGSQIRTRDLATGQPLWSGGAQGGQAQAQNGTGLQDGSQVPQPQAQVSPDAWYTVEGQVTAVAQNSLTIMTNAGTPLTMQLGRPGFAADQGVLFNVGDEVRVLGYDQTGQFRAGEITNLTQGGRLMLLDPNGRPLWAGPGGNGAQGTGAGNGSAGAGGQGAGNQAGGAGNQGAGTQATGTGGGRGYRGGR